jgi:hypothetical protein
LYYTDLFLSAKKKYKPVAKKVCLVIGELPEKFHIEHKIIGNPLDDLPALNPNPLPFTPTDRYTLKRRDQLDKNHPGNFLWPAERTLMHNFMLAHDSGFAWSEEETKMYVPLFRKSLRLASMSRRTHLTGLGGVSS